MTSRLYCKSALIKIPFSFQFTHYTIALQKLSEQLHLIENRRARNLGEVTYIPSSLTFMVFILYSLIITLTLQ